jgi:hypothetical protein
MHLTISKSEKIRIAFYISYHIKVSEGHRVIIQKIVTTFGTSKRRREQKTRPASISPTFYAQLFRLIVLRAAYLYFKLRLIFFGAKQLA